MVEEERIITASNGGKYLIVKQIDDFQGAKFFFAIGVTDEYEIDYDNLIIFKAEKEGDKEFVTALDEKTDEYQDLMAMYYVKVACEFIPGARQKADKIMKDLEEQESSK